MARHEAILNLDRRSFPGRLATWARAMSSGRIGQGRPMAPATSPARTCWPDEPGHLPAPDWVTARQPLPAALTEAAGLAGADVRTVPQIVHLGRPSRSGTVYHLLVKPATSFRLCRAVPRTPHQPGCTPPWPPFTITVSSEITLLPAAAPARVTQLSAVPRAFHLATRGRIDSRSVRGSCSKMPAAAAAETNSRPPES
jgi:hypothetical protein